MVAPAKTSTGKKPAAKAKPQKKSRSEFVAPADFAVDETARNTGKVVYYNKSAGFGFIKPDVDGLVPDDKVMVHWREISSSDAWPFLYKGLEVEFGLAKYMKRDESGCYIKGKEVTMPGRAKVALQDELEDKREYVHSKQTRFTGHVKFYNAARGFGYVVMEDGYANVDHVPKELRVARHEIRSGDEAPLLAQELKVEFGIVKNLKENWACYNLTLPGGEAVSRNVVEQRKTQGSASFTGTVQFFDRSKGFGYIKPDGEDKFPAAVDAALEQSQEKAKSKLEKKGKDKKASGMDALLFFRRGDVVSEGLVARGGKAEFKLYLDNRGAGACDVKIAAA